MSVRREHYEELLAEYSNASAAIALLKRYRPYLELLPSMRRPDDSLITIPLPIVRARNHASHATGQGSVGFGGSEARCLTCDIAMLMCDPEWKIKTGVEIFVFIHRPDEDFSDLLGRWRQTQVCLSQGYEWDLPHRYRHILNEGAENIYPLFVVFDHTPERIKRGLKGAFLPFVVQVLNTTGSEADVEQSVAEVLWTDNRDETFS